MSELFSVKPKKKKKVREPAEQILIDTMRKVLFAILIFTFAFLFFYAALNFWDVVIGLNDFMNAISTILGFG
jgi:hypothetical protein